MSELRQDPSCSLKMMNKGVTCGWMLAVWLAAAGQACAGMTVISLTDIARARIDAISFFVVLYLLIGWAFKGIWNQLAKSFVSLPRLGYLQSLGVVFTSGLLFYVVLTMISGARELMTPGAWEKQGVGYHLRESGPVPLDKESRRLALRGLQEMIWTYARDNGGNAPAGPFAPGMDPARWQFQGGGLYGLMPGVRPGVGRDIVVYEPSTAGGRRFVLLADGSIEDRAEAALKRQLDEQVRR